MENYIKEDGTLTHIDIEVAEYPVHIKRSDLRYDFPSRFSPNVEVKDLVKTLQEVRKIETRRTRQFLDKK